MEPVGQFSSQAPHSIQASGRITLDTSATSKTVGSAGHTAAQVPQAIQPSSSTTGCNLTPPLYGDK